MSKDPRGQRDSLERLAIDSSRLVWHGATIEWPMGLDVCVRPGNNPARRTV